MSKLKKILEPQGRPADNHPSLEELAVFVDIRLENKRRNVIIEHLATCADCYDIVQQTLLDLEADKKQTVLKLQGEKPQSRNRYYALAASLVFLLVVASGLWFKAGFNPGQPLMYTASVELDTPLQDILLENDELVWSGDKARRFLRLLQQRGVELAGAETVMVATLYDPYRSKGLVKVKEILLITVEDGVVQVVIENDKKAEE